MGITLITIQLLW